MTQTIINWISSLERMPALGSKNAYGVRISPKLIWTNGQQIVTGFLSVNTKESGARYWYGQMGNSTIYAEDHGFVVYWAAFPTELPLANSKTQTTLKNGGNKSERQYVSAIRIAILRDRLDDMPNGPHMLVWGPKDTGPTNLHDGIDIMYPSCEQRSAWIVSDPNSEGGHGLKLMTQVAKPPAMKLKRSSSPTSFNLLKPGDNDSPDLRSLIEDATETPIQSEELPAGHFVPVGDDTWLVYLYEPFYFDVGPTARGGTLSDQGGAGLTWHNYLHVFNRILHR